MSLQRYLWLTSVIMGTLTAGALASGVEPTANPESRSVAADSPSDLLAMAPADAWLVAYVADIRSVRQHPVLGPLLEFDPATRDLLTRLSRTLDGPIMLTVGGVPTLPFTWRFTLAARTSAAPDELFDRLANDMPSAWENSPLLRQLGHVQFNGVTPIGSLTMVGPLTVSITIAYRDGMVYASSIPGAADNWLGDGFTIDKTSANHRWKKVIPASGGAFDAMLYVNVTALTTVANAQVRQLYPELAEALQLGRFEWVALVAAIAPTVADNDPNTTASDRTDAERKRNRASVPPAEGEDVDRSPARRVPPLRLTVGVSNIDDTIWHLLASEPSAMTLARFYPQPTTLFVHGSMERATDMVEDVNRFVAMLDEAIADEYKQECAEFKREIGFDPHADFLANLVKEWAVGLELVPTANPLLTFRLEDAGKFNTYMHTLRVSYQLETTTSRHRNITITHALRKNGSFAYAVVDDVLLVSTDPEAVAEAIDIAANRQGLDRLERFADLHRQAGDETAKFVYVNIADLMERALTSGAEDASPPFLALARSQSALGAALTTRAGVVELALLTGGGKKVDAVRTATLSLVHSLARARELAKRQVVLSAAANLTTFCSIYAANNDGAWPTSLEELVRSGVMGTEEQAATLLANPLGGEVGESDGVYFLYRHIADTSGVEEPAQEVVVSEPALRNGGAAFGFLDGHAEWIEGPKAERLLAIIRAGR